MSKFGLNLIDKFVGIIAEYFSFLFIGVFVLNSDCYAEPFVISVFVDNNQIAEKNINNFLAIERYLNQSNIDQMFQEYSGVETLKVMTQYGKFMIDYEFPVQNSSKLVLNIPAIDFHQSFEGTTRDESTKMALEQLKDGGYLKRLQSTVVKETARNDGNQLAGLAFSLLANTVRNDFFQYQRSETMSQPLNQGFLQINYSSNQLNNQSLSQRGILVGYRYLFDQKTEIGLNLPVWHIESSSKETYSGVLAGYIKRAVTDKWHLGLGYSQAVTHTPNTENSGRYRGINFFQSYQWNLENVNFGLSMLVGDYKTLSFLGYDPELRHSVNQQRFTMSKTILWTEYPIEIGCYVGQINFNGENIQRDRVKEIGLSIRDSIKRSWGLNLASELADTNTFFITLDMGF